MPTVDLWKALESHFKIAILAAKLKDKLLIKIIVMIAMDANDCVSYTRGEKPINIGTYNECMLPVATATDNVTLK